MGCTYSPCLMPSHGTHLLQRTRSQGAPSWSVGVRRDFRGFLVNNRLICKEHP